MRRRFAFGPAAGMTLIELVVVVVILAVLAVISLQGPHVKAQVEEEHNAQLNLQRIWTSEKRFYAFNSNSAYTNSWPLLNLPDPSNGFYSYNIVIVSGGSNFTATAAPRQPGFHTFSLDQKGIVNGN